MNFATFYDFIKFSQGSGLKYKGSGFVAQVQGVHDYRCLFPLFSRTLNPEL